ncbi:3-ketoacyl-ACP reductase [Adhaeribacter rhizoryzae]|uniref:3-ketoacyl-ACP reductase n=1 Tax=Adhaeribacter rhizoryzae TaxID=2607907 RepID=A0A5M6DSM3_9BACT|nr:3-ketoacyl-ACP reductase [Adhaeribacter rhizoryzae]KAA5549120.1 3-ketoacyl-ACP reductase [Adhaeribacter rhizoryzae]
MKRVAFITGGSRGIGYGIAAQLALAGFDLAINGVRPLEAVTEAIEGLKSRGSDVIYVQGDVASPDARTRMLDEIKEYYGRLHVLVNNAGIAPRERKDILEATEESFSHLLQTNLQGPYFLTQAVANWFIQQQSQADNFSGCIVNVSSISATVASVNRGEYCIAKAGLSMATQLWATRLGEFNIPVYEVRPGIIRTDMTAGVTDKYDKLIAEGLTVQKRWGTPEDVGKAVAALAKGDFPYSTGQVIMVDGGLTLSRL